MVPRVSKDADKVQAKCDREVRLKPLSIYLKHKLPKYKLSSWVLTFLLIEAFTDLGKN